MNWHAIQLGQYSKKERIKSIRVGIVDAFGGKVLDCPYSDVATLEKLCSDNDVRLAYTCGMHWTEREARAWLESKGIPLVVLDLGYFKRARDAKDTVGYNQVGLGKIGWVPTQEVDSSRWDALGIPDAAEPVSGREPCALVLGQVPNDSQHGLNEKQLNRWFDEITEPMRKAGTRVVFRPHPLNIRGNAPTCDEVSKPASCSLVEALAKASLVITYNSTAGLEAILAGVPVICHYSAHYYYISWYGELRLPEDDFPVEKCDVMRHMHRLAWAQWTCAEIERGDPIRFLSGSGYIDLSMTEDQIEMAIKSLTKRQHQKYIALLCASKPHKWQNFDSSKMHTASTREKSDAITNVLSEKESIRHLIAIPFFGTNPKYLEMLHTWVAQLKKTDANAEFIIFTHDAETLLKPFGYPVLKLDISAYVDVIREGQPFDLKGALMCEAALTINRPFFMIDSDALLIANPSDILDRMGDTPCAMPIDHGAILSGHQLMCDEPISAVRKMCAGVFWFGLVSARVQLVEEYKYAFRELDALDYPWTPRIPHLLEQYAWSLAHHRMGGATLPATFNWAPHIVGASRHAIVNHFFGHKKWNGNAPKNT